MSGQAPLPPHPLGYRRWHIRWLGKIYVHPLQRVRELWWILIGKHTLHSAWQRGYDQHIMDESARRANGGR